jgi:hypothetical protein
VGNHQQIINRFLLIINMPIRTTRTCPAAALGPRHALGSASSDNRQTVSRNRQIGLRSNATLAYVGKTAKGDYKPFCFNQALMTGDVEFSEEMFLITRETAEAYLKTKTAPAATPTESKPGEPGEKPKPSAPEGEDKKGTEQRKPAQLTFASLAWTGEVPPQKWMNFPRRYCPSSPPPKG